MKKWLFEKIELPLSTELLMERNRLMKLHIIILML